MIRLCQYYPIDFNATDILELDDQLDTYILTCEDFGELQDLSDLAQNLVAKK